MTRREAVLCVAVVLALLAGMAIGSSARGATPRSAQEKPLDLAPVPAAAFGDARPAGDVPERSEAPQPAVDVSAPPSAAGSVTTLAEPVASLPAQVTDASVTPPTKGPSPDVSSRATWNRAVASWYGAEVYGNRTACGQTYGPSLWGVAHKSLPCGTVVQIRYGGRVATVPVRDRGPYIAGRTWDLSAAVARYLGFDGVHTVEWRYGR